jgi:transmembrane sensor
MTTISPERIKQLLLGRLEGTLDPVETDELWQYVLNIENRPYIESLLGETFSAILVPDHLEQHRQDEMIRSIMGSSGQAIQPIRRFRLWPRIVAAASIILVLGIGTLIYINRYTKHSNQGALSGDVTPGKQDATLTLADGKKIRLADVANGELAKEVGIEITKSKDGQLIYKAAGGSADPNKVNTLSTANGETYQVSLSDGSRVWLNSASSLTYSASLTKTGNRLVRLKGEGYFEVAKDKMHPFIVETSGQQVEVLGTHFNINAYQDDGNTQTTLLEGSVRVNAQTKVVLKPGQQSVLNTKNGLKVRQANLETVMAWKNGDFIFKDESLENIMMQITRWYDVEVVYEDLDPKSVVLGGWVSRSKNLSAVLKIIESIAKVHFKVEGRRVTVMK